MKAFVGLTSGLGDRESFLSQALERISYGNDVVQISNVFESAGDGVFADSFSLLSVCVELVTDMTPQQLLRFLVEIENQLGRARVSGRSKGVAIDLDLLIFEGEILRTPLLTLPHSALHERPYVLVPLTDIAADLEHPILHRTIKDLAHDAQINHPQWGRFFMRGDKLRTD